MAGAAPVAAGRVNWHEGTDFASLRSGGTIRLARLRGLWRLTVPPLRSQGFAICRSMPPHSRPNLQRSGPMQLASTTPYKLAA
jgi:hypothetical protein